MAVRYTCDICGKKCSGEKYYLPWPKTYIDNRPYEFRADGYNLCTDCCNSIFETVILERVKQYENN